MGKCITYRSVRPVQESGLNVPRLTSTLQLQAAALEARLREQAAPPAVTDPANNLVRTAQQTDSAAAELHSADNARSFQELSGAVPPPCQEMPGSPTAGPAAAGASAADVEVKAEPAESGSQDLKMGILAGQSGDLGEGSKVAAASCFNPASSMEGGSSWRCGLIHCHWQRRPCSCSFHCCAAMRRHCWRRDCSGSC
jgi:hypothetical protein